MENDNIDKGVDMASEPAVAYGRAGSRGETSSSAIRKINPGASSTEIRNEWNNREWGRSSEASG